VLERVVDEEMDARTVIGLEEVVDAMAEAGVMLLSVAPMGQGKREKCDFLSPGGGMAFVKEEEEDCWARRYATRKLVLRSKSGNTDWRRGRLSRSSWSPRPRIGK
jgi:hypothetical protein